MDSSQETQEALVRSFTTESVPRGDITETYTKPIGGEGIPEHYQEHVSAEDFRLHFSKASIEDTSPTRTARRSVELPSYIASLQERVIEKVKSREYAAAKTELERLIKLASGKNITEPSQRVLRLLNQSGITYDADLEKIIPPEKNDKEKLYKAIFQAISVFDVEMLDVLCNEDTIDDVLFSEVYTGWTALAWAARIGSTECINLLIEKGADVNKKIELRQRNKFLKGGDMIRNSLGAVRARRAGNASAISDKDPMEDYVKHPGMMISCALHAAALYGQRSAVTLLLQKGADINARNEKKDAALHLAVGYCRNATGKNLHTIPMGVAEILLEKGADIEAKDMCGNTPLHAGIYGTAVLHSQFVDYMVSKGADINSTNNVKATPLIAAFSGVGRPAAMERKENISYLFGIDAMLKHGADINAVTNKGYNALHYAASTPNVAIVKLLLDHGIPVNGRAGGGELPLLFAVKQGHYQTARMLIEHGADVNFSMKDSVQPTFVFAALYAQKKEHLIDILRLLVIEKGADINSIRDNKGNTPLHVVAWNGMTEAAKVLIQGGAVKGYKNNDGWTPLKCAKKQSNKETATYLHSAGCR